MEDLDDLNDPELFNKGLKDKLDRYVKKQNKRRVRKRAVSKKRKNGVSSVKKLSVAKPKNTKRNPRIKSKPKTKLTKEMRLERTELLTSVTKLSYLKQWGKLLHDSLKLEGQFSDSELLEFLVQCAVQTEDFQLKFPIGSPLIKSGEYKLVKGVTDYGKAVLQDLKGNYCNYCRRQMYVTIHRGSIESLRNQINLNETIKLNKK